MRIVIMALLLGPKMIKARQNQLQPIRIGVVSPNFLLNVEDVNMMCEVPECAWPFDSYAKKASLLFDKIYLTHDLDVTCSLIEGCGSFDGEIKSQTIRYLAERDFILRPMDMGYTSADQFLKTNMLGTAAEINKELTQIGNPGVEGHEDYLIGQPDIGDFAAHDGWHPRAEDSRSINHQRRRYEALLLRRNAALIRNAGLRDVVILDRLFEEPEEVDNASRIWKVLISEMPQLDTRASWEDVLDFGADSGRCE